MLRGARAGKLDPNRVIESSVDILIAGVNEPARALALHRPRTLQRSSALRYAIRTEIRLITSELAIDLARFPGLNTWSSEDLNILASLFVNCDDLDRRGHRGRHRRSRARGDPAAPPSSNCG